MPGPLDPTDAHAAAATPPRRRLLGRRMAGGLSVLLLLALLAWAGWLAADEIKTSRHQAQYLAEQNAQFKFALQAGPSSANRPAGMGPFDQRMGYHALPATLSRLNAQGFGIDAQALWSAALLDSTDQGFFTTFAEKNQAGLALQDCRGEAMSVLRHPQRQYGGFDALPPLVVAALLFIEDRQLLDAAQPRLNPALDWSRLARALADQLVHLVKPDHATPGGSTLATQIEKYRHSPGGRTDSMAEKWRQMVSASLRAYPDGELNFKRRQQIVVDYLDTVPLAARAGFGEVHGLGDALWAWYGREFDEVNTAMTGGAGLPAQALAFKQALSLLVAQRRPSHYLGSAEGAAQLEELSNSHLRVLAQDGVIPAALRDAALALALQRSGRPELPELADFNQRKAVNALRKHLGSLLAVPDAYALDRIDLQARSSLHAGVQQVAGTVLRGLAQRDGAAAAGLYGPYLLRPQDDPSRLLLSFTLYEVGPTGNQLRVQTDNLNQPFDINEGARLDLGSTAKLRTLVTYLQLLAELHKRWHALDAAQLAALDIDERDTLGRWTRAQLIAAKDRGLPALLEAAMLRRYSANPGEGFYTGGGVHHFGNFEPADNLRIITVREALTRSVNLVFIRLMRDVVRHLMFDSEGSADALSADRDDPARKALLARFADKEGSAYLQRYYQQFQGRTPDELLLRLLRGRSPTLPRLASVFGELQPEGDAQALAEFIRSRSVDVELNESDITGAALQALHQRYGGGGLSLSDRGYVAGMHPLALWLAGWLQQHPQGTLAQALAASSEQRQAVYGWLFKTRHRSAQDNRIRSLLEEDVFAEIQQRWQRLGYPFAVLTPSYATAIGASGDRPSALAELMGIIVNGGRALPVQRINQLVFAEGTPYETHLSPAASVAEQVLAPEVAATVRTALLSVVEDGTARRLKGAFTDAQGQPVAVGGKTGTGDHRRQQHDRSGRLLGTRVISRSATLMFLIGDRWFGTVMAYVKEPYAADYKFTSALPAQLLKSLAPTLQPLLREDGCR